MREGFMWADARRVALASFATGFMLYLFFGSSNEDSPGGAIKATFFIGIMFAVMGFAAYWIVCLWRWAV
jgi:hypothetical protein